jgi:paraquat-inducible protein B
MGCINTDLRIQIRFDRLEGLEKGCPVYFNDKVIGKVEAISLDNERRHIADVIIKSEFAPSVTEHSKFVISHDPGTPGKKAIEVFQSKDGGVPLKKNALVIGSSRMSALTDRMQNDIKSGMEIIKEKIERFSKEMRSLPEKNAVKNFEKELQHLYDVMKGSSETVREKVKKELLPQLKKELEDLKKRLKELGREEESKPLETQFEKITTL